MLGLEFNLVLLVFCGRLVLFIVCGELGFINVVFCFVMGVVLFIVVWVGSFVKGFLVFIFEFW